MIAAERCKQRAKWTAEHDDTHDNGELAVAARSYAVASLFPAGLLNDVPVVTHMFEWPLEFEAWQPGPPEEMLAKAGAFIAAEIDRRRRARLRTWVGRRVRITTESFWHDQVGTVQALVPENCALDVVCPDGLRICFFESELELLEAAEDEQV